MGRRSTHRERRIVDMRRAREHGRRAMQLLLGSPLGREHDAVCGCKRVVDEEPLHELRDGCDDGGKRIDLIGERADARERAR